MGRSTRHKVEKAKQSERTTNSGRCLKNPILYKEIYTSGYPGFLHKFLPAYLPKPWQQNQQLAHTFFI